MLAWVDGAAQALFPPACLFCRRPLGIRGSGHAPVCDQCARSVRVRPRHRCRCCGRALPEDLAPGPCGRCLRRPPPQAATEALYVYDGAVRQAILDWKLSGADAGVRWLLEAAAGQVQNLIGPDDLLLPVPMPLGRMRASGQHHAAALCRMLAAIADCSWDWRLLRRVGEQPRQSALTGLARRRNLARAFAVDEAYAGGQILPSRLWLVDDILTTGTTARYAARALRRLDRPVHVLTLARAGKTE
jgi:predicted amidophosphoribosyltransferase